MRGAVAPTVGVPVVTVPVTEAPGVRTQGLATSGAAAAAAVIGDVGPRERGLDGQRSHRRHRSRLRPMRAPSRWRS